MNHEGDRITFAGFVTIGLHDVALHALLVPALEVEGLEVAQLPCAQHVLIDLGQALRRAAIDRYGIQIVRCHLTRQRVDDRVVCHAVVVDLTASNQLMRGTIGGIDPEKGLLPPIVGGRQQLASVGSGAESVNGPVPVARQFADRAGAGIADDDVVSIGLEPGPVLCQPREVAVLQEHRLRIPRRIVGSQVLRRRGAVARCLEQVEVGRPRLAFSGDPEGEHDRVAIGAEGIFLVAAEWLGGNVAVQGLGDIDLLARFPIGTDRRREQMRSRAVAPGVPVTDEDAVVESPRRRPLGLFRQRLLRTLRICATRQHFHREGDAIPRRGKLQRSYVQRVVRDLRRFASVQ